MSTSTQHSTELKGLRLLVPIDARAQSRWALEYAVRRRQEGRDVEVVLLNVGEIVDQWQVLRFRTQREISDFQAARAQAFIDEAEAVLAGHAIDSRGLFKQGDVAFSIVDTAEQLDCDEIVLPAPSGWQRTLFGGGVVAAVQRLRRAVPVVLVDRDGRPGAAASTWS